MKKLFLILIVSPFAIISLLFLGYILLFNLSFYNAQPPRAPKDATVHGQILLVPDCAVEKDAICESKPYETEVTVSYQPRPGADIAVSVANTMSDTEGRFTIPLRPSAGGVYHLQAKGGQSFPRCKSQSFTINPKDSLEFNIACETGAQ